MCSDGLDFFQMDISTLNTFSKTDAEEMEKSGFSKISKIIKVPVVDINQIFSECVEKVDLLSIDTEGLDFKILDSLNFNIHRPFVVCVESVAYHGQGLGAKDGGEINELMEKNDYELYADTHINSIFVDKRSVFKN
jgi:hypothetical protein